AFHLVPDAPADGALFALMQYLLTPGLLGIAIVSLLAIIMSTIDSAIMVGASTLTKDFYHARNTQRSPHAMLRTGRIAALFFGAISLLIAFFVRDIVLLTIVSAQLLLVFTPALLGSLIGNHTSMRPA